MHAAKSTSPIALAASGRRSSPQSGMLVSIALFSAFFFAFVIFSRITELGPFLPLHLAAVGMTISLAASVASGTWATSLSEMPGKLFLGVTVWMVICIPFSIWPGGSFDVVQTNWLRAFALFVVCAGPVVNWKHFLIFVRVVAIALFIAVLSVLSDGSMDSGRLTGGDGFFSNPNDLGTIIAMGMPLFWLLSASAKHPVSKLFWLGLTVPMWRAFFQTGSRGGFLGFCAITIFFLLRSSMLRRVQLTVSALILLGVASILVPGNLLVRFVSLPGLLVSSEQTEMTTAEASADARKEMAIQAIKMTFQKPIFGVGSGNFKVWSTELYKAKGENPPWTDVHNTFLQMSSENGIPAFIMFLAIIVSSWKRLTRVMKSDPQRKQPVPYAQAALYLKLSFIAFMVCGSFGNYAYQYHLPILAALALSLHRAADLDSALDKHRTPIGRPSEANWTPQVALPPPVAPQMDGSSRFRFGRGRER